MGVMEQADLLEHRDFVKAVAGALLRNDADVDDVVQETYVAALQGEPPRTGRVRPWLGGIARNLARGVMRKRARARRRERAVAKPDLTTDESTERLRWQQRVVEEVLALDTIYRDVLLLRYYEELPPREIAKRLDVPVNTVRTRTRRGIERLRKRFDERFGRKAWSAGLAAFFAPEAAAWGKLVAAALVAVVAGTAWLGHAALRGGESRTARRSDSAAAVAARPPGPTAPRGASEARTVREPEPPARFHGRLLDYSVEPHPPLANAAVHLTASHGLWPPLASTVTDADGRFSIPWNPAWPAWRTNQGFLSQLLYVERDGRWSDAMYTSPDAIGKGMELPVQLLANPRFQFVRGPDRAPVAGARVSLFRTPGPQRAWLDAPITSGTTGADGIVETEWPTHHAEMLLRVEIPGGDTLQWPLSQLHVRSFDPYDVAIDPENIAHVSVRVLDREGRPAGPGTTVLVQGSWAPDGGGENANWKDLSYGAQSRTLFGTTDGDGRAAFRFPADRAAAGVYVPGTMMAYDDAPRLVLRHVFRPEARHCARNGLSLPTLRFGADERPRIFVRGRRLARYYVHAKWKGDLIRPLEAVSPAGMPGFTVLEFADRVPRAGPVTIAAHMDDGYAWRTLDESEFARCLAGHVVVEFDRRARKRTVTLRPRARGEAIVEACGFPFAASEWLAPGHPESVAIPAVNGTWRIVFNGAIEVFDPEERSELTVR